MLGRKLQRREQPSVRQDVAERGRCRLSAAALAGTTGAMTDLYTRFSERLGRATEEGEEHPSRR